MSQTLYCDWLLALCQTGAIFHISMLRYHKKYQNQHNFIVNPKLTKLVHSRHWTLIGRIVVHTHMENRALQLTGSPRVGHS